VSRLDSIRKDSRKRATRAQKQARKQARRTRKRLEPVARDVRGGTSSATDTAMDWAAPKVEAARDWAAPRVETAVEWATPRVETAVEKVREDLIPKMAEAVVGALAATEPARKEAKVRGTAAVAALKGELEPPKSRKRRQVAVPARCRWRGHRRVECLLQVQVGGHRYDLAVGVSGPCTDAHHDDDASDPDRCRYNRGL